MKIRHILFSLPLLTVACSNGFVIPDPVPGGKQPEEQQEEGDTPEMPGIPDEPEKLVEGMLRADGNDADTYQLILDRGYNYETPDESGAHAGAPFRHIKQSYDATLKKPVFDFYLHILNDDDRGKANITDRQRNEIKTDAKSPASMVAQKGETLRITWKFRLPEGFQTTTKFAHIHQLKGIDNAEGNADVSMPLITFTCRSLSNGKQQFQVIYTAPSSENSTNTYIARADLADFLGEWVTICETVKFDDQGSYSVLVYRVRDGKLLAEVKDKSLHLWREGTTGLRPKWGLYRNFGEGRSLAPQLRDEVLKFADFRIEKL